MFEPLTLATLPIRTPAGTPIHLSLCKCHQLIEDHIIDTRPQVQERLAIGGETEELTLQAVRIMADYIRTDQAGLTMIARRHAEKFEQFTDKIGFNPLG